MNKIIRDFIREKDRKNWEFWEAYYKWMDAREEMNRPVREYLHRKLMDELDV